MFEHVVSHHGWLFKCFSINSWILHVRVIIYIMMYNHLHFKRGRWPFRKERRKWTWLLLLMKTNLKSICLHCCLWHFFTPWHFLSLYLYLNLSPAAHNQCSFSVLLFLRPPLFVSRPLVWHYRVLTLCAPHLLSSNRRLLRCCGRSV